MGVDVGSTVGIEVAVRVGVAVAVAGDGSLANPCPHVLFGFAPRACAFLFKYVAICCGAYPGDCCLTSAAIPATCGDEALVPQNSLEAV